MKKTKEEKECTDSKCPFHGSLKLRGREFVATVISSKMQKTVTVEWLSKVMVPKYERYIKKRARLKAHNPECIKAEEGDIVRIKECRPLSKTVSFVVIENLGKEKGYIQKKESLEEGKFVKSQSKEAEKKDEEKKESND